MNLQMPHPTPGSAPLTYVVKEGDTPGAAVQIQYTQAASKNPVIRFVIPPGAIEGTTLELERPGGGDKVTYVVPVDVKQGDEVLIEYEPVGTAGGTSDVAVNEINKPTTMSYLNALTIKTIQFQKTRAVQCCCIMIMPVVLMLLLLLLNLIFAGIKVTTLCGPGITKANCEADGYNLTCVASIYERSRPSAPPALRYGEVQRGFGINANCGGDAPKRQKAKSGVGRGGSSASDVCYEGIEKPMFSAIPFTATSDAIGVGENVHVRNEGVIDWYNGFRSTMTSSICQELFAENFDYDIVCADDKGAECTDKVNQLVLTQRWRAANPKDGSTSADGGGGAGGGRGFSGFLGACLPANIDSRRRLAEFQPTDASIAEYDVLVDNKATCEAEWLLVVSARLAAAPALTTGGVKSGVLGQFTTETIQDEGYTTIQSGVLTNAWKYLDLNARNDKGV